jgi:hypothetical protein
MRKKNNFITKYGSCKVMIFNDRESQLIFGKNQTVLFLYFDRNSEKFP